MSDFLLIFGPGLLVSLATFIVIESMAWERDSNNIRGFLWGIFLAILSGSIVDMIILLILVRR